MTVSTWVIWSFDGWRVAHAVVAALSLLLAGFIWALMRTPMKPWRLSELSLWTEFQNLCSLCRIPSFLILVLQGIAGSMSSRALDFLAMYFLYLGMETFHAGLLVGIYMTGKTMGNCFGGWLGDFLARWSPYHGRPLTAQLSLFFAIPLAYSMFVRVSKHVSSWSAYGVHLFALGLVTSWSVGGVNGPILSELVPRRTGTAMALFEAISQGLATLIAAPLVAFLAQDYFGYEPRENTGRQNPERFEMRQENNANALANAMMWCAIVPWTLCLFAYSLLHLSYRVRGGRGAGSRSAGLQPPG